MAEYPSDPQDDRFTPTLREILAGYALFNAWEEEQSKALSTLSIEEHPQQTLDLVTIREALAGYAAASEVVEAERREQLAHMTTAEALAIWRDLVSSFNARPKLHENLDRLDLWQVEGLLTIRRALDQLAGYQPTS